MKVTPGNSTPWRMIFKEFTFFISSFLVYFIWVLLWQQIHPSKFNTKFKISSQLALPFWNIVERPRPKSHSVLSVRLSKSENSFELRIFFESYYSYLRSVLHAERAWEVQEISTSFAAFLEPQNTSLPRYNLRFRPLSQVQLVFRRSCW